MPGSLATRSAAVAALTLGLAAAGCGSTAEQAAKAQPAPTVVQLASENVVTAMVGTITSGPAISGQLTPAREATVRAQIGGSVVTLPFDRGQAVKAGEKVAEISSRDLETSLESVKVGVKAAEGALAVAQSEAQRTEALVKGGAIAARELEQAKNAVTTAEAQVAAAHARQESVQQQLNDTIVRAPFSGIVSSRKASVGDVVSSGTELLTIIDPSSMRLEALVPSDDIPRVHPGATVQFTIRGVPGRFEGSVDRFNPWADPTTRQVSIFVSVPNEEGKLIAGLFAQGRVASETRQGVIVPLAAVDETGPVPTVTRIAHDKAERVIIALGPRQTETEQVEVTRGVSAGDVLVIGSAKGITPGTPVKVVK